MDELFGEIRFSCRRLNIDVICTVTIDAAGQVRSSLEHGPRCNTWAKSTYIVLHFRCTVRNSDFPTIFSLRLKTFLHPSRHHSGYVASAKAIVGCAQCIAARVRAEIPELRVLGKPPGPCVAFAAAVVPGVGESVDALAVGDAMSKRGWHLNGLSSPPAVHIACTVSQNLISCGSLFASALRPLFSFRLISRFLYCAG